MNESHKPSLPAERRKAIRHACVINATAHEQMMHVGAGWLAKVADISITGVRLHLAEGFPTDSVLTLDLHGTIHTMESVRVRVVRCVEQPDGTWIMGAAFVTPLQEDQLQWLLVEKIGVD